MRRSLTFLAIWIAGVFPIQALAGLVQELLTPDYVALIVDHCERGVLDCKNVEYFGVNRNTGASIHLRGQSIVGGGAGNLLGYQFKNGKTGYFIYVNGSDARLSVEQDGKILAEESGSLTTHAGFE
ncbi:MAG: hypothetical protein WCB97_13250 [Thiobacillus sp.]